MTFLLREVLLEGQLINTLAPTELSQLITQARTSKLLATLALKLEEEGHLAQLPPEVRRHFDSAVMVYNKQRQDLDYEITCLQKALAASDDRLLLLKGAAYIQAELPLGRGRMLSDVDILVPQARIDRVENTLLQFGWVGSDLDEYNERYYRQWMHEIPPMGHPKRGSTLDLHHTILPPTADATINASLLFEEITEVKPDVYTLSNRDMLIHSATHLFHEGEFHNGLRDLWDLDRMLRDFGSTAPDFWESLIERARQLDLLDSLLHALRYTQKVFDTPIPDMQSMTGSDWTRKPVMDFLFARAFRPDQPDCRLPLTGLALEALYVRSHYLRMPLHLLIPHLTRKAWSSRFGSESGDDSEVKAA